MSREYVCDNDGILMGERYPDPADESMDFCSEKCYEEAKRKGLLKEDLDYFPDNDYFWREK